MGYAYLAELAQRPEYRKLSERLAVEITRKWMKLKSTGAGEEKAERLKELDAELKRLKVREAFAQIAVQDGLFGRAHLYLDTGATDDRDELVMPIVGKDGRASPAKIRRKSLQRIKVVEAVWCYPSRYNASDPLKDDWFCPERWFAMGKELHKSRLLTFIGRPVPDLLKPAYSFGGLALSQMAKPYVDNWLRTRQSIADLISNFSKNGIATDLQTLLYPEEGSGEGDIFTRVDLYTAVSDNRGMMILDKETEEFFQFNTPLGTLDALQSQALEQLCFVGGYPVIVLLGLTPQGFNASSEGEMRAFEA
jgi:hypothetical protein